MIPKEYQNLVWFNFPTQVLSFLEPLKELKTFDFEILEKFNDSLDP